MVRDNLVRTGFGENQTQRLAIEKEVYKHFCDLYLETFKSLVLSKRQIQRRFVVKNSSLLQNYALQGKSVIMMCGIMLVMSGFYRWDIIPITLHMVFMHL